MFANFLKLIQTTDPTAIKDLSNWLKSLLTKTRLPLSTRLELPKKNLKLKIKLKLRLIPKLNLTTKMTTK